MKDQSDIMLSTKKTTIVTEVFHMNSITQDIIFKQSVVEYSIKSLKIIQLK